MSKKNIIVDRSASNDVIRRRNEEILQERLKKLREQLPEPQKCSKCSNPIFESYESNDANIHKINKEPVCKKCYFDALGKEIEKYPIGSF